MPNLVTRRKRGGAKSTKKNKSSDKITRRLIRSMRAITIGKTSTKQRKHTFVARSLYHNELLKLVNEFIDTKMTANDDYEYRDIIRKIRRASRGGDIHKLLKGLEKLSRYYFPDDPYLIPWTFVHDARIAAAELEGAKKDVVIEQLDELTSLISKVRI